MKLKEEKHEHHTTTTKRERETSGQERDARGKVETRKGVNSISYKEGLGGGKDGAGAHVSTRSLRSLTGMICQLSKSMELGSPMPAINFNVFRNPSSVGGVR